MTKVRLLAVVIATLFCTNLSADEITMKNGDRLTGTIVKSDAKALVIKSEFAGEVSIQWDAITSIQSAQPIYMGLKDGQTVAGTVSTSDGKFVVDSKNAGVITVPKDSIVTVRNQSEETAYNSQIDRLRNPHLTDFWSGFFDTGLSITRGNSEILNFSLSGSAVRKTSRDTITAYASSIFANNASGGSTETTANAIGGGLRVDINVSKKLYVFGFADFYHDQFQQLDLRNILGGGLGYHVINTKPTVFDVYGGAAFNQSYYSTPLTQHTGEIVVGEYFAHSVSDRTTFDERFEFFPNLSNTGEYRYTFDTHLATRLNRWLSWQVSFGDKYVSDPPPEIKKNDIIFSTGLRLTFGQK